MEPFEIEPSYDREDPFGHGPRVLWGRVAVLAGGLILFFLFGRITAGGGGSSASVTSLQNQLSAANSKIASLEASLSDANGSVTPPATVQTTPSTAATGAVVESPTPPVVPPSPAVAGPITYTVKVGDTLSSIEVHFYHHLGQQYTTLIEQANGLTSPTIHPGQKLIIPPASSLQTTTPASPAATAPDTTTSPAPSPHPSPSSTKK